MGSFNLLVISGAFIPFMEFLGMRKESKSASIREWSGMCSEICFTNLIAAVGAKMLFWLALVRSV